MPTPETRAKRIFAEQIQLLYSHNRDATIATVVNSLILTYIQRDVIARGVAAGWLIYMLLVAAGRAWLAYRYRQAPDAMDAADNWGNRYIVGSALQGLGWGAGGVLLFPPDLMSNQIFTIFVLAGMSAGAVAVLTPSRRAFLSFFLPTLIPLTLRLFWIGDDVHLAMGVMAVMYTAVLWATAWRMHRAILTSLTLRYENKDLIAFLTAAKDQAERLNEELKGEINQRQLAETALRHSEEQFRQSQKLEAIGKLAGGVAHEFNNLIQVIKGYCYFLFTGITGQEALRQDVEGIEQAADRAADLTNQLLAFSRRQIVVPRILDVNAAIVEQHRMLDRLIGEDVRLDVRLAPGLYHVKADPAQIGQMLLNLVNNARDAMPQGGVITIETANLDLEGRPEEEHRDIPRAAFVTMTVRDTGPGIPPEHLSRIFEPFFTTKEVGKGTGLGLSTVYGLVSQAGGHVRVASRFGEGAAFTIYLPAIDKMLARLRVEAVKADTGQVTGSESLLVVEDERGVRQVLCAALRSKGYDVLEAKDGREALDLCRSRQAPVHLLVADLVMPGMGGDELARQVVDLYPAVKILFISGYSEGTVNTRVPGLASDFLKKPFSPDTLLRKVRSLLDAR